MIDRETIIRIIDDFETKAEQTHEQAKKIYKKGFFDEANALHLQGYTMEYAANVLRQVI